MWGFPPKCRICDNTDFAVTYRAACSRKTSKYTIIQEKYQFQGTTMAMNGAADAGVPDLRQNVGRVLQAKREFDARPPHANPDWRKNKVEWDVDYRNQILQEIVNYDPEHPSIKFARILLLGPIGSGKSSFFNTISSIMKGRITQRAPMGSAEHSLTVKYKVYDFRKPGAGGANRDYGEQYTRFQLCDTMGMEEKNGVHNDDLNKILDGNIPDGYQFNPTAGMAEDGHGYKKNPDLYDKIHCVVLVVDGSVADVLQRPMVEKLQQLRTMAFRKCIPVVALLTKVDLVCGDCMENLTEVFRCRKIKELVETLSGKLGLPKNNIIPVKSYESENDLEPQVDILALNALRQMLNFCDDFLGEHIPRPLPPRADGNNSII